MNGVYTLSVYAKAGAITTLNLWISDSGSGKGIAYFNLSAGTVSSITTGTHVASATITSAGNGWYRCTITTPTLANNTYYPVFGLGSTLTFLGDGTSGIYLWGAQLEQRSAVTAYTATTTQAITNYIPVLQSAASGVARFDNNPTTGESLGLLIEESRTNLTTYSSQFDNAAYTKISSATITTAANVAPDGTLTAQLFTNGATASRIQTDITVTTATAYTASIYAKAGNASYLCFGFALAPNSSAIFNLTTGVVSNTAGSPTSTSITAVGNGWYRCSITVTSTSTSIRLIAGASSVNTFASAFYPNGTTGDTGFIWGAQVEAGAFATSYIPTVASQVTRAADAASMTGTNFSTWFNAGEGTIYSESAPTGQTSNGHVLFSMLGTADNYIVSGQYIASSTVRGLISTVNNSNQVSISLTNGTNNKMAGAYKVNDFALCINGGTASTDTSGTLPIVDKANIGNFGANGQTYTGTIKKIAYYPLRVTNAQLQALTS
jgi:hypothetical protein